MKNNGKNICKHLKNVRQQIAKDNDIPLEEHECQYEGPCNGTCPRCEAELQYLEKELNRKRLLGKAALVAGVTMSLAAMCNNPEGDVPDPGLEGDVYIPEDTTQFPDSAKSSVDYEAMDINIEKE